MKQYSIINSFATITDNAKHTKRHYNHYRFQ